MQNSTSITIIWQTNLCLIPFMWPNSIQIHVFFIIYNHKKIYNHTSICIVLYGKYTNYAVALLFISNITRYIFYIFISRKIHAFVWKLTSQKLSKTKKSAVAQCDTNDS